MVTRIENRRGDVLAEYAPAPPERALDAETDKTLLSVMRDVVTRGTGGSIRTRFGIRGDVAGKTGTTQDNADGWFILMQPGLVAGAWVGFDDGRVTLRSDYWGQGAHSALPIVGDFFQRAQRARLIDTKAKFDTEPSPGWFASLRERATDLFDTWFPPTREGARTGQDAAGGAGARGGYRRGVGRIGCLGARSGIRRHRRGMGAGVRSRRVGRRAVGGRVAAAPAQPPAGRARRAEAVRASAPHRRPPFDRTAPGAGTGRARRDRRIAVAVTEPFRTRAMLP